MNDKQIGFKVLPARKQCPRCELIFNITFFRCPRCYYPHLDKRTPIVKNKVVNFQKWAKKYPGELEKRRAHRWEIPKQEEIKK